MSEGIETLLEKKKGNGIMLGSNFIFSEIFISECTLSLNLTDRHEKRQEQSGTVLSQAGTYGNHISKYPGIS